MKVIEMVPEVPERKQTSMSYDYCGFFLYVKVWSVSGASSRSDRWLDLQVTTWVIRRAIQSTDLCAMAAVFFVPLDLQHVR